ncbi:MAG: energy-coupling factor transporter ATPase [Lachnospiraceae bacterium]|nr:energy-coupling factor transporter ATPase [Lachnospiraceae bacterium]
MALIDILHLFHSFYRFNESGDVSGTKEALRDVTLSIEAGSFVAVLGHNGSGKSTLAKHINALFLPSKGQVLVDGRDTKDAANVLLIRHEAGMVFQNPDNQMIANVVEEEVAFGPENIGVPTEEIWERVGDALERVGMTAYRMHSPDRLSGGQKQRVAIAGIVAMKPQCIILDEPTAMLDPMGRREVLRTLHELNQKEKITILLITHHMDETIDADRVIVMDDGEVVLDDVPRVVFSHVEELKSRGLDVPVATQLAYELRKKGLDLPEGILSEEEFTEAYLKLCR